MNYELHYNLLIAKAEGRKKRKHKDPAYVYYEKHHVIPKCLGGSNDKSNLVLLTAREHFVAHWLLTKLTSGQAYYKCLQALAAFQTSSNGKRFLSSRQVEKARLSNAEYQQHLVDAGLHHFQSEEFIQQNRERETSLETRLKIAKNSSLAIRNGTSAFCRPGFYEGLSEKTTARNLEESAAGKHPFQTEQVKAMSSRAANRINETLSCCLHCKGQVKSLGLLARWHGRNCMLAPIVPAQILLTGAHRVGKGELLKSITAVTSCCHTMLDRGYESTWAFAKLFGRADIDLDSATSNFFSNPAACLVYLKLGEEDYEQDRLVDSERHSWAPRKYSNRSLDELIGKAVSRAEELGYAGRVLRLSARAKSVELLTADVLEWLVSIGLAMPRQLLTCYKCEQSFMLSNGLGRAHLANCKGTGTY